MKLIQRRLTAFQVDFRLGVGKSHEKICDRYQSRRSIDWSVAQNVRSNSQLNYFAFTSVCFFAGSRVLSRESCVRHPRDENTVMVAAGASEQQKQHELKEESGFAGMGFKRESRGMKREERRSRRDRRVTEEKIEGEIPRRSPRDVILFNDNGCEVDACQLGNAFGVWFLCVPLFLPLASFSSSSSSLGRAAIRPRADGSGHLTLSSRSPEAPILHHVKKDGPPQGAVCVVREILARTDSRCYEVVSPWSM